MLDNTEIPIDDTVLIAYARAMRAAQSLESRFRVIFALQHTLLHFADGHRNVERLLRISRTWPLEKAMSELFRSWNKLGLDPFPNEAVRVLKKMVRLRDRLAHRYFEDRAILTTSASAPHILVSELDWYRDCFEQFATRFHRFIDLLKTKIGSESELREFEDAFNSALPGLERDSIDELRRALVEMGLDPLPIPESVGK